MNLDKFNRWRKSLQTRSTIIVLVLAAVLIELTSLVQYFYARQGIREGLEHRAKTELQLKGLEIQRVMTAVETAADNSVWMIEQQLAYPDSLRGILRQIVKKNPMIIGTAVGFEPNFYPKYGRWFEPYATRTEDGFIEVVQIGSEEHDYHQMEWYSKPKELGKGYWSEPYFDKVGAMKMLCTYAVPIHDSKGRTVGVVGADVSLDWLGNLLNANPIYPSAYNLLISRTGKLMACPVESLILNANIHEATARVEDTTVNRINQQIMSGISGQATVINEQGEKDYVYYAPVEGETGWSMAVVCSDRDIFKSLRQVAFNLLLLMLVGLALMSYILFRTIRGYKNLQAISAEKERIGSELHIASAIQMSMLPKLFPPYPDRDDLNILGSLTPAKEVGGDLYDFYLRDEKLIFIIGDVSGKGVPASLVMAVTRSLFRTHSAHESDPSRILTLMNDSMAEMNESNMFVTCFLGSFDLPTGRLRYSNAGHNAPMLVGQGVGMLPVESNIPLGVMNGWRYPLQEVIIEPQTTIFLYTDGLTEAENINRTQFGMERMMQTAQTMYEKSLHSPDKLLPAMGDAVKAFVGEAEQSDDLTMFAIQYTKTKRAVRMQRNITLTNDVQEVPKLSAFVDEVCEEMGFEATDTMQMNLAIEEAVVNVMNYAYLPGTQGDIDIVAQADDLCLKFTISDSGTPFDPTARPEADTTLSAEERPIGGLGIYLVRQLMDSINYERIDNKNVLTLRKKLTSNEIVD